MEVIVIGGNHHNTLSVLRSLGQKKIYPKAIVLAKERKPYVLYSKFISEYKIISDVEEISRAMYELHSSEDKAIVIACADIVSSYLDSNRDILSKEFILPGSEKQGEITHLMNKENMTILAQKCGLVVPKSWTFSREDNSFINIEYPCIIKPLISKDGTKADIAICNSRVEFEKYIATCKCDRLQVQKYIKKDIEFQLIGCSLNAGDILVIPGASVIMRQPQNTNTGFLKYIPRNNFSFNEEACRNFIKATGYSGLFSLEFLRDKDGIDYFMEINFRNDGNAICVTASGINLPYIWYLHNTGTSINEELNYDNMKEVLVMPEFDDFINVIKRRISLRQWILDVRKSDAFMEYSSNDKLPFYMGAMFQVKTLTNVLIRKIIKI